MRRHGAEILRFCLSVLGDRAAADDVHQTVFVEAWQGLEGCKPIEKPRAWLFGIARHRCLDAVKARRRWFGRFSPTDDVSKLDVPASFEVSETFEISETVEISHRTTALAACVQQLAPHARVAVLLRYEEGLPYAEIARMSRETAAALQTRVARALIALRACLKKKIEVLR